MVLMAGGTRAMRQPRAITAGQGHHWFGYYDKLQFDPAGRRVLGMRTDTPNRSPEPSDVIQLGVIDLADDRWTQVGESRSWCWQQGWRSIL